MDFEPPPERRMLAETLGRYLDTRYPFDARNRAAYGETGHDPGQWSALTELGAVAALFDEAAGGLGGSGFDIAVVFEAVGRHLVVEPLLGALMAGRALAAAGRHDELERIISGEAIAAFAHEEADGDAFDAPSTRAAQAADGSWTLQGAKAIVPHAEAAPLFVVTAATAAGLAAFLVPDGTPGLSVRGYPNIDGGRSGEVTLDDARLPANALLGSDGGGAEIAGAATDAGLLALTAEALGLMEAARDATLAHLRTRTQFGAPIGRFQALQHRMVTVALEIEQARSAVINAADAYDGGDAHARALALSAAKHTAGRVGRLVAEEAVQLHGGMGMTWEMPVSHLAKRLTMIDHQLGDEDEHLQRYIALSAGSQIDR